MNISLNGNLVGSSQCPIEVVNFHAPDGSTMKAGLLYDTGSDSSIFSNQFSNYFWDREKVEYYMSTPNCKNEQVQGEKVKLCISGSNGKRGFIYALSQDLQCTIQQKRTFQLPKWWGKKYKIPDKLSIDQSLIIMIVGVDLREIFPVEKEREGKLSLCKSKLSNEFMVCGNDGGGGGDGQQQPPGIKVHRLQLHQDIQWLRDEALDDRFPVLPRVCSDHKDHKCVNCEDFLGKSQKTRQEEDILFSCLQLKRVSGDDVDDETVPPLVEQTLPEVTEQGIVENNCHPADTHSHIIPEPASSSQVFQMPEQDQKTSRSSSKNKIERHLGQAPTIQATGSEVIEALKVSEPHEVKAIGRWYVTQKYTEDIKKVPEGYNEVLKVQLRQEVKMKRQPEVLKQFNEAFKKKNRTRNLQTLIRGFKRASRARRCTENICPCGLQYERIISEP